MSNKIFFSYSFKDEEKVAEVRRIIESIVDENNQQKYFVFMASDPIFGNKSGRSWSNQEMLAMTESFLVILFLSDNSIISDGVSRELIYYFKTLKKNAKTKFLYVTLNGKKFIDSLLDAIKTNRAFIEDPSIGAAIRRFHDISDNTEFDDEQLYIDYNDNHLTTRLSMAVNETYATFNNIPDKVNEADILIENITRLKQKNIESKPEQIPYKSPEVVKQRVENKEYTSLADIFDTKGEKAAIRNTKNQIHSILMALKIDAAVCDYHQTLNYVFYEIDFRFKKDIKRLDEIKNMLSLVLNNTDIAIHNDIIDDGKYGIIIPNETKQVLEFGEMLTNDFLKKEKGLICALGTNTYNEKRYYDITKMPHCLVAGATNSGKTNILHTMIVSLLLKYAPSEVKLVLADPKQVEFLEYNQLPHLLYPVITEPKDGEPVFNELYEEMNRRYSLLANSGVYNIEKYNDALPIFAEKLPYILVVIDEYADFVMYNKNINRIVCALATKARAAGIHVILSTQRPTVDVIDGVVKASFGTRIAAKCTTQIDSRTILDSTGAEKLYGYGDVIISFLGQKERVQMAYIKPEQLRILCNEIVKKYGTGSRKEIPITLKESKVKVNKLVFDIIDLIEQHKKVALSTIQSNLNCGFSRAVNILEKLVDLEVVGRAGHFAILLVEKEQALKIIKENAKEFEGV